MATPDTPNPGGYQPGQKVFGRYTLIRLLGQGGMGVVWLAWDETLELEVALKFLSGAVARDAEAVRDLKRETRRALRLTHPRIVRIYDFVEDAHGAGIAMEYVPGRSLAALKLEQPTGCFEVAALAGWVAQLCDALAYAHAEAQIVHRDLKPANLMLDAKGALKVADFGISATLAETSTRASRQVGNSGTPLYMSPQQMLGERPAATDDIYALGATLYELLTGKPPFYAGNIFVQLQQKVPPSLATRRAELGVAGAAPIPAEWETTIAACLAKEAGDRPASAQAVRDRLAAPGGGRALSEPSEAGEATVRAVSVTGDETLRAAGPATGPQAPRPWTVPDLDLALQPIAAGAFLMGSENEKPVTHVQLTRPFWLGRYPVTQGQWTALMGGNPAHFVHVGRQAPVEQVSWLEALAFCETLTARERAAGRLPAGYVYTLPTEAQWEYACRAGTTGDFAGPPELLGWYDQNSGGATHPVGQKQANAWGLHDMHGNVWEWCADWHGDYPGGAVSDPVGPAHGTARAYRGGCWMNAIRYARSACRSGRTPDFRGHYLGFRLALSSVG